MDLTTERPRARASAETPRELAGEVVGSALYRLTAADVPNIRKQPGPVPAGSTRAAATLLRHSDHQTIAATAALYSAMSAMGMTPEAFVDWGVVAATRYLGRSHLAVAVRKFDVEGVWGVSPHLIPHFALHSTSGTLSLALGIHGPNLGVGGGAHSEVEGFLASLTWLAAGVVPGVWLVLTGWEPELAPGRDGQPDSNGECRALALALAPAADGRLNVRMDMRDAASPAPASVELVELAARLAGPPPTMPVTIATDPRGRIRVELVPIQEETP